MSTQANALLQDRSLAWLLPLAAAALFLLSRPAPIDVPAITAQQAKDWGLIWDVVDDAALMATATELARRLADGPTLALARIKAAINAAGGNDLAAQLDLERDLQRELGRSEDFREGVAAFLAKRKPAFKGR